MRNYTLVEYGSRGTVSTNISSPVEIFCPPQWGNSGERHNLLIVDPGGLFCAVAPFSGTIRYDRRYSCTAESCSGSQRGRHGPEGRWTKFHESACNFAVRASDMIVFDTRI